MLEKELTALRNQNGEFKRSSLEKDAEIGRLRGEVERLEIGLRNGAGER